MTSILLLISSFLISTLLGAALGLNLIPGVRYRSTIIIAAPILGIGISSLLFFLWMLAFYPTFAPYLYTLLELAIAATGLGIFVKRKRKKNQQDNNQVSSLRLSFKSFIQSNLSGGQWIRPTLIMAAFSIGCLIVFVARFISYQYDNPYGDWDAWAIWNMRARYLVLGGEDWLRAFSPYLHGADYPVLISFYTARVWAFTGNTDLVVPHFQALVFSLSSVVILFDAIRKVRSLFQGLLAASILMLTPSFIRGGVSQYADIPLGAYYLLTGVLLFFYFYPTDDFAKSHTKANSGDQYRSIPGSVNSLVILAGVSAGFALWTKNEGLFLLIGVLLAQVLSVLLSKDRCAHLSAWKYFWIGTLPALGTFVVFKLFIAPANYVFDQSRGSLLTKMLDTARHKTILLEFLNKPLSFGDWRLPLVPLVLVYGLIVGIDHQAVRRARSGLLFISVILVSILLLDYTAYLVTTLPLEWQLKESLERLLLHIYPLSLFTVFYMLREPWQLVAKVPQQHPERLS